MPFPARGRELNPGATTTEASRQEEAKRWLNVYHSAVEYGRSEGFKDGHRQGHREGWEQGYRAGYEARGREDEVFAQAVADRLFVNEIRVGDRRKFVKWLIESGKAQEARRLHYERFDKGKGPG